MSANAAALPSLRGSPDAPDAAAPHAGPRVHVIQGTRPGVRAVAWPFIVLAALLVMLTVALPMAVNTQMAQRAYEIRDQQIALAELNAQAETLEAQLLVAASPQSLEAKAEALGLVLSGPIGAISLKEGTVEGGAAAQ